MGAVLLTADRAEIARFRGALDDRTQKTGDAKPAERRPDRFDRVTGERLTAKKQN